MSIFFSSDEHYHHTNIIRYTNRPFDNVQEMNEILVDEHNKVVKDSDITYHMGDFTFRPAIDAFNIIKRLNGKHVFIRGNHDAWLDKKKVSSEDIVKMSELLLGKDKILTVEDYLELKVNGVHLILSHFPMLTWHKVHRGSTMLHGHCHGTLDELNEKSNVKRLDVGVDSAYKLFQEYRPFRLTEVVEIVSKRGINPPDWFDGVGPNKPPEV